MGDRRYHAKQNKPMKTRTYSFIECLRRKTTKQRGVTTVVFRAVNMGAEAAGQNSSHKMSNYGNLCTTSRLQAPAGTVPQ